MNFNFDLGLIDTIKILDCTANPPAGGVAGVLTIEGTGALVINKGTTAQRPASPIAGMFRFNTENSVLEVYDGTEWDELATGSGVTSVALEAPVSVFDVAGSPITDTGTLQLTFVDQLANTVFAAPDGSDGTPTFRALVFGDLPIQLYAENPATPTAPQATGDNAVAIGSGAVAAGDNAVAIGTSASASVNGSVAMANGSFAAAGDAQGVTYVLRNETTDDTPTELFLDGASQQLTLVNNVVMVYQILVTARRTDAVGGGAGYQFLGVVRKDATAASIALVGGPSKTVIGETNQPWDVSLAVNTTTGALTLTVVGEDAKTIRWVAVVRTAEVVGAA